MNNKSNSFPKILIHIIKENIKIQKKNNVRNKFLLLIYLSFDLYELIIDEILEIA
jgi:hypothetical protein